MHFWHNLVLELLNLFLFKGTSLIIPPPILSYFTEVISIHKAFTFFIYSTKNFQVHNDDERIFQTPTETRKRNIHLIQMVYYMQTNYLKSFRSIIGIFMFLPE